MRWPTKKLICKGAGSAPAPPPGPYGCYQTLGDLTLTFDGLDETATTAANWTSTPPSPRSAIARATPPSRARSSPAPPTRCWSCDLTCDKPGRISFTAELTRPERFTTSAEGPDGLIMSGQMNDGRNGTNGIRYVDASACGGRRRQDEHADGNAFASRARMPSRSSWPPAPTTSSSRPTIAATIPTQATRTQLAEAAKKSYAELRDRHVADHQSSFAASVSIWADGPKPTTCPPTNGSRPCATERRTRTLIALYFQFGRYLLDLQFPARQSAGQPAGHLGRRRPNAVERRLPHEHQRADELLAGGGLQPGGVSSSRCSI